VGKEIDWDFLVKEFAPLYGEIGIPSIQIRTIVGLLFIKHICIIIDKTVRER